MLFADLLSLHLVTFLLSFILVDMKNLQDALCLLYEHYILIDEQHSLICCVLREREGRVVSDLVAELCWGSVHH